MTIPVPSLKLPHPIPRTYPPQRIGNGVFNERTIIPLHSPKDTK